MLTLAERLKTIRETTGNDQKTMAKLLGISFRSWQDYELGKSVPGGKVFEALVKLGYNSNWLLTGNGGIKVMVTTKPFYKQLIAGEVPIGGDGVKPSSVMEPADLEEEGFVKIPRYEVAASAGGGAMIHSEQIVDHLTFRADWVRNALGVPVSSLALINVRGDSMEPTLANGDVILIDMSAEGVEDNAVYVLRYDNKLVVKRVQRRHDGSVTVKGDNPVYEPETIKGDLVSGLDVVGRVVWCGRRM